MNVATHDSTIRVDVVERGRALVVNLSNEKLNGYARRDGGRLIVVDDATDEVIGTARTYEKAGLMLAAAWGIANPVVVVDREY